MDDQLIVTFGKYKGKTIVEMCSDVKYCEWLTAQDFFKTKHERIYNIIVLKNDPSLVQAPTPEHNKMQNLFLDDAFVKRFIADLYHDYANLMKSMINTWKTGIARFKAKCESDAEKQAYDVLMTAFDSCEKHDWNVNVIFEGDYNWDVIIQYDHKLDDAFSNGREVSENISKALLQTDFSGYDIYLSFGTLGLQRNNSNSTKAYYYTKSQTPLYVEVKPTLGDEYPCVLRKMRQQIGMMSAIKYKKYIFLFIGTFSSRVTSEEQLRTIFGQHDIRVVFEKDFRV